MLIACHLSDLQEAHCLASMLRFGDVTCELFPCESTLIRATLQRQFDVIVLDGDPRRESRRSLMKWVQCRTTSAKVLLLSDEMRPEAIANALACGIDELLVRPYSARELITRVQVTVQRARQARSEQDVIEVAGYRLQRSSGTLWHAGLRIDLTPRQFLMAWIFFSSPGVLLVRETLAMAVWGAHSDIAARTIEQHVYTLRKKLGMGARSGVCIRTAYARGYRLEVTAECPGDDEHLAADGIASACGDMPWNGHTLSMAAARANCPAPPWSAGVRNPVAPSLMVDE